MRASRLFVAILVLVAVIVLPAGIALAYPPANPVRTLPDEVERGATFDVTVNFTAPADNFTCIGLVDTAPDGWNMTAEEAWCTPRASMAVVESPGNVVSILWIGETHVGFPSGTPFTALYKVTVPCGASLGSHSFNTNYPIDIYLDYYIGNVSHFIENITGDYVLQVIGPAICNKTSIDLYATVGQNPQNETLELWSSTPCMLNWSVTEIDADWLEAYPRNGSCTYDEHSFVNLSVNTSDMSLGDYPANITINSTEANNSPHNVPVTLHITEFGILKGQVNFSRAEDPGDPTWETPLVVQFYDNSTKAEMGWSPINITTDAYGKFTIADIEIGTYDIAIKNCTCLSEMVFGKELTAGNTTYADFGTSREGDCNEDDWVTSMDRGLLHQGWGTTNVIQGGYYCDLNRDGWLTSMDRGMMHENWGIGGDLQSY